jgi:peptide chain release factor 2
MNKDYNLQEIYNKTKHSIDILKTSINRKIEKLKEIENFMENKVWKEEFHSLLKEESFLKNHIEKYNNYLEEYNFIKECIENNYILEDLKEEIGNLYEHLNKFIIESNFKEEDKNNCFMEIQAGAGGDDTEDLCSYILKMYLKWSEKYNYQTSIIDINYSDHGIKSALLQIEGINAYGFLKHETGIHRFVRYSPFNALNKRQTSFIAVYVYTIEENIPLVIEEKHLEYSFFKSSGAGGQHVNKTESAVRIKHIPTGVIVQCQNERSQNMNKNMALKFLKIKLQKLQDIEKEKNSNYSSKQNISWGQQIRSYIFNPYKLIKDLRSGYETQNVDEFMNGNLLEKCLYYNLIFFNKN